MQKEIPHTTGKCGGFIHLGKPTRNTKWNGSGGIRTHDIRIKSATLLPLSYQPKIVYCSTTSTIVSGCDGICNLINLNKKYGKIVSIDNPINVAKNIILLTFQMCFDFLQFVDTINWHNYKSDKTHYINNNFHFVSLFLTRLVYHQNMSCQE